MNGTSVHQLHIARRVRTGVVVALMICLSFILSGCAYPEEQRRNNQRNPLEFIVVVQQAVELYQQKTGVLPIKNSSMETPIYEKYQIDFGKLQKANYLSTVPTNAYENGGSFIYVLVNVEIKPEVKLLDLLAMQEVVDLQQKVNVYEEQQKKFPIGIAITEKFAYLDYDALQMKPPSIYSVYHPQQFLNFIIETTSGHVAIDYAPDILQLITEQNLASQLTAEEDLRERLVNSSVFVPVSSFTYIWKDNQPIPVFFTSP